MLHSMIAGLSHIVSSVGGVKINRLKSENLSWRISVNLRGVERLLITQNVKKR